MNEFELREKLQSGNYKTIKLLFGSILLLEDILFFQGFISMDLERKEGILICPTSEES